ncbi:MAG: plasmid pRiA4b ORF-3 family protein [Balneolaceae bacterium]|nr:MAG: plasmid pRiA4b ORF-3 family protein [Balneolaceae bacterium]
MAHNFTTNLRHYLDETGQIPINMLPEARKMASFLTALVESVTSHPEEAKNGINTGLTCPVDRCGGLVSGQYHGYISPITWKCPKCGSEGDISNWQHSNWDFTDPDETEDLNLLKEAFNHFFDPSVLESGLPLFDFPKKQGRKKAPSKKFDHYLQLKISLENTKPSIWRRIEIPCTSTFWDLHVAIQDAMGWTDSHLHQFEVADPLTGYPLFLGVPHEEDIEPERTIPEWEVRVASYLTLAHRTLTYEYDFGDGWVHKITLESIGKREKEVTYPRCTGGRRACPPEDSGGPHVFGEMLDLLENGKPAEKKAAKEELGPYFEPDQFDPSEVKFQDPEKRFETYFDEF